MSKKFWMWAGAFTVFSFLLFDFPFISFVALAYTYTKMEENF